MSLYLNWSQYLRLIRLKFGLYIRVYGKRGISVRIIYLGIAAIWWVLTCLGCFRPGYKLVLCYHGITKKQKNRFKWQMSKIAPRAILAKNFSSVRCRWRGYLPQVIVTFDDAFVNLLDNSLPVLEEMKIPATIFVVVGNLGDIPRWRMPEGHPEAKELLMTAEQITAVAKNPLFRIGSHTLTHPDLTQIPNQQVQKELIQSKKQLERLLGISIEDVALPYGAYNQDTIRIAQAAGYKRIFTLDAITAKKINQRGIIGRFCMSPDVWKIEYILTCAGAYAWLNHWRRFLHRIRQWRKI